jgi:hypothetical protein
MLQNQCGKLLIIGWRFIDAYKKGLKGDSEAAAWVVRKQKVIDQSRRVQ